MIKLPLSATMAAPRWGRGTDPQVVARPPNLAVLLTHCGQLILRKISKSDATRCQILRLNAQNSISAGDLSLTRPSWESLQSS